MTRMLLVTALLLSPLVVYGQETSKPTSATSIVLTDARPNNQKANGFESINIMRCSYASMRIGDDDYIPNRIQSLREVISDNFPSMDGKNIIVRNYVIHLNTSTQSKHLARQMTGAQIGGAIGGAITPNSDPLAPKRVIGCASDDLQGGYLVGEVPLVNSPMITVIDLEVDGHAFHFRSISDTEKAIGFGRHRNQTSESNYQRAHSEAMEHFLPAFGSFVTTTYGKR